MRLFNQVFQSKLDVLHLGFTPRAPRRRRSAHRSVRLAKRRFGEAAISGKEHCSFFHPVARPFSTLAESMRRRRSSSSEEGFTLIELVIVIAVMPLVVGAITVGVLSVFSLQSSVASRLTDSGDAQVVSLHMQNDVQSAVQITTSSSPQAGDLTTNVAPCLPSASSQVQLMALVLGNGTVVTYAYSTTVSRTDKGLELWRNVCSSGSSIPTTSAVVAHDVPTTVETASPISITCSSSTSACAADAAAGGAPNYTAQWVSTLGITGVTFKVTAPDSSYSYTVTALPVATGNSNALAQVSTPTTGCDFAVQTSGTYAGTLCFVDMSPWNAFPQVGATGFTCNGPQSGFSTPLAMSANISNTPFTLQFCVSVNATLNGNQLTGQTQSPTGACGVSPGAGVDDIKATAFPTYTCPGSNGTGSEAFLGNNGFYTGVTGAPALYTQEEGSLAVINITNIELLSSTGDPATGWELVTGDAESTDGSSEYQIWQSNQPLSLLPNSSNSPVGNACGSFGQYAPPNYNPTTSGLYFSPGNLTVECTNPTPQGANHTGTPMLEAATPSSLTVTLKGSGLEATFLGVILP
jgi:prepilin-type N-terminal cleavage/methylation domain-containing protein